MKKLFYILILFVADAQAQLNKMIADTAFYYTYGGVNFDEARDIKETPDKGYVLAGTTASFGPGQTSFYLIKTDSLGNHVWSSVQGGPQNDWAYTVQVTPDSGIFAAGFSNSFDPTGNNKYSAYYVKTDKNGQLLWQKTVYTSDFSFVYGSCALPDSGFILCGKTYANSNGGTDAYLIRINKNGDTLWTHHYGGMEDETFNSVCLMNNKLYAAGSNATHPTDTASDGWIVKLNLNGTLLKDTFIAFDTSTIHPLHYQETLNCVSPFSNTSLNICGSTYINNSVDTNVTNGILTRIDTSLHITNSPQNIPSGSKNTIITFNKVFNISQGRICLIGTRNGGLGGLGMFFAEFDLYTNYIPNYLFVAGGSSDEYGYSGIYSSAGKLIGVGSTLSYGAGSEDAFLVRFDSDSINNSAITHFIQNNFTDNLYLSPASIKNYTNDLKVSLYPNPSSGKIQVQITGNEQKTYTITVYGILGAEVYSSTVQTDNTNPFDLSFLNAGSYFLKIQNSNSEIIATMKFIISK
jgi:hypothetical protein